MNFSFANESEPRQNPSQSGQGAASANLSPKRPSPEESTDSLKLPAKPSPSLESVTLSAYEKFRSSSRGGVNEVVTALKELLCALQPVRLPDSVPSYLQVFHGIEHGFGKFGHRVECILQVVKFCAQTPQVSRRLRTMLFQMMRACSAADRQMIGDLLEAQLSDTPASRRAIFHSILLFSTGNFQELHGLVEHCGARKLFDFKNRELSTTVADVVVTAALRKIRTPAPLKKTAAPVAVRKKFDQLKLSIDNERAHLEDIGSFSKTEPARRALKACDELERYLQRERKRARKTAERIEVCNTVSYLLKVHRRYNLKVSAEWSADQHRLKARWASQEALDLSAGLKKIPEVLIIATGKFRSIMRQRGTEDTVYGDRLGDGRLRLFDTAANRSMQTAHYNRISPFKLTTTHEGLHALKFGWYGDGSTRKSDIRELVRQSAPVVNLADFLRISGWQVIDPSSYQSLNGGTAVEIDGIPYATDQVVHFGDTSVIFRYDKEMKTLFSHSANAAFVLEAYSTVNPWEDFCESLTVYLYIPKQLIDHAPLKYIFAEQLLGLYHTNDEHKERLRSRLARTKPMESQPGS